MVVRLLYVFRELIDELLEKRKEIYSIRIRF